MVLFLVVFTGGASAAESRAMMNYFNAACEHGLNKVLTMESFSQFMFILGKELDEKLPSSEGELDALSLDQLKDESVSHVIAVCERWAHEITPQLSLEEKRYLTNDLEKYKNQLMEQAVIVLNDTPELDNYYLKKRFATTIEKSSECVVLKVINHLTEKTNTMCQISRLHTGERRQKALFCGHVCRVYADIILKTTMNIIRLQSFIEKIENPWEQIPASVQVGSKVKGKVSAITDYGLFVEVQKDVEGLVHISEVSGVDCISDLKKHYAIGDMVEALVISLDKENRRMSLSIKQLEQDPILGTP